MLTHLDISTLNEIYREKIRQPQMLFYYTRCPTCIDHCPYTRDTQTEKLRMTAFHH